MANDSYDAPTREKHWQEVWEKADIFRASNDDPRPKCYVLEMFPYPSGASTSATPATTPWATSSPATSAPRA